MKAILKSIIAVLAVVLSSCGTKCPYEEVAKGMPIMPVHMNAAQMDIYMTDYVPSLAADSLVPEMMSLSDDGRIRLLSVKCQKPEGCGQEAESKCHQPATCNQPYIVVLPQKAFQTGLTAVAHDDKHVTVALPVANNAQIVALVQNMLVPEDETVCNGDGTWTVTIQPQLKGRSYLRVYACDDQYLYNDVLVPLENGKPVRDITLINRHDLQGQVLYSLMVDRFANGNRNNDWKMKSPEVLDIVDYQGGDFAGIKQKIEDGFFDELGINTIWVSPVTQNPWDAWGKYEFKHGNKYDPSKPYTKFSGYHGYWPIYATVLDLRFGTDEEFAAMLAAAHRHGINVILDYVANHMHINSPTYQAHPTWHTDSILPDGRRNFELWDDERLTTWFDRHIPTLDLEREEICDAMTDSALFWLEKFELDGFRHDACKHIPEGYWRMLGQKMAKRFPGRPIWMIGETYGSPELIGSYVKSGMLNAQFDFNIYFAIRDALIQGKSFESINATVLESMAAYGAHHTMGNISGNHDQIRFASMAGGAIGTNTNGKEEGWTSEVGVGDASKAYQRALTQEALNLTLPGVPCIYQGDEYAEVGGNDPDNRHMMRFDGLSGEEQAFREKVKELITLRRHSMALMYGDYVPVTVSQDTLVFERRYMNEVARVTIIRDEEPKVEIEN